MLQLSWVCGEAGQRQRGTGQPPRPEPGGHWPAPPSLQEALGEPMVTLEGWLAFVYSLL